MSSSSGFFVNSSSPMMNSTTPSSNPSMDARLKKLYPLVNEAETPLPRCWNNKDKYNYIGLSMNSLRVHYKGHGKGHKDAASVRATHPIPVACGLFYFEVKIISKGRDGYMGIGLSSIQVNMNRLPGWDKNSYGYHGDDGHSFCSSGTGQPYGPTFTTGDVIGCGLNLVDNSCFYTKNGHYLGIAFSEMPSNLYPTVGLQTPGEIIDANFGQQPFVFDIEDMMEELRLRTRLTIENYPIPQNYRNWEGVMNKMVMSYLVHHGYCSTAEAFAKTCGQAVAEDLVSMKNRQKIQQLILRGNIQEAEEQTRQLYPNLLDSNPDLLFMLRCRQFVELVGRSTISEDKENENNHIVNGSSNSVRNHDAQFDGESCLESDEKMEVDPKGQVQEKCEKAVEKILQTGRELQTLSCILRKMHGPNAQNKLAMEQAFSLLAYADPWNSPMGWQLEEKQREPICAALNSAILQSVQLPRTPPLQVALHHAHLLLKEGLLNNGGSTSRAGLAAFIELLVDHPGFEETLSNPSSNKDYSECTKDIRQSGSSNSTGNMNSHGGSMDRGIIMIGPSSNSTSNNSSLVDGC